MSIDKATKKDMYRAMKDRKALEYYVRIVPEKKKQKLNKRVKITVSTYYE